MKRRALIAGFVMAAWTLATATALRAQSTFITGIATGTQRTGDGFTLGGYFTVTGSNVSVISLGVEDVSGTGLTTAVPVDIWAGNGHTDSGSDSVIATGTISTGTSPALVNGFRYVTLSVPVTLTSGSSYTIGAYYTSADLDKLLDHGNSSTVNSSFTSIFAGFTPSNTVGHISEPTGTTSPGIYIGPNFQFNLVPEPSTWLLFATSALGLFAFRKRLRWRL